MKRNIFQKQDDSEITEPVENKQVLENNMELNNNSKCTSGPVSGLNRYNKPC